MNVAIRNATIVPVTSEPFVGTIVLTDGRIAALGDDVAVPSDHQVVDARGGWVLPGFVDAHVHLGVWEEGEGWAGQDTNEMTDPVMAAARALDAINPFDQGFADAVAAGVTAVNVNPGSGNPIGGLTVSIKTWGSVIDDMVLRSPSGLKSALGENPKRVYGEQKKTPSTRLGTALVIRKAFTAALNHQIKDDGTNNLVHEALLNVLNREIPWRQHCHRADDIVTAIRLADEFGYELVLDHGTESWKIADLVASKNIPVLYGPLIVSRSKVEVRDRLSSAPGILDRAGVPVSIITDHPVIPIEYLVTQAAIAVKDGMDVASARRAITINPARVMGVDDRIGSLETGKDADVVLWSGDPFELNSRALSTWISGRQVYSYDVDERAGTWASRR